MPEDFEELEKLNRDKKEKLDFKDVIKKRYTIRFNIYQYQSTCYQKQVFDICHHL